MSEGSTLSVCMIVRDEAEVLRVALESVRDLAVQIVVVDTGSRDATPELAREWGAEVHAIRWTDDFAAARNASLEHARGDWILVLDADEWIAPRDHASLRSALVGPRDRVWEFEQRNYVPDAATPGFRAGDPPAVWGVRAPGYVTARQVRLLPNDPRLRYEGRVHEQLEGSVRAAGLVTHPLDVITHHIGKMRDAAVMYRKSQLYAALGEAKLRDRPDGRALLELGVQCIELGERERAVELLVRALAFSQALGDRAKIVAHLAGAWASLGEHERADALLREHLPEVSAYSFVWERWGSVLGMAGRTARAAEVLERASRLFDDAAGILRLLGETYLAMRQFDRARLAFERLRDQSAGTGLGEAGVAVSRAGQGDHEPLRALLERGGGPVSASARAGALRWLGPQAILRAWPRAATTPDDVRLLDRVRQERGLEALEGSVGSSRTLEALWRRSRGNSALAGSHRERLAAALGLDRAGSSVAEGSRGQIVQVPIGHGR